MGRGSFSSSAAPFFWCFTMSVDAADGGAHAGLQHLFGELFFVEGDHFLDVAHAAAAGLRPGRRSRGSRWASARWPSSRGSGRARCAWRFRLRPRASAAERCPSRAGTCGRGRWSSPACPARGRARHPRPLRRPRARPRRSSDSPASTSMPWVLMVVIRSSSSSGD